MSPDAATRVALISQGPAWSRKTSAGADPARSSTANIATPASTVERIPSLLHQLLAGGAVGIQLT
jgi:hypothetical protein